MLLALDRFFFNHYCNWFRSGAFGESISKIPMLNICDDHVSACLLLPNGLKLTLAFAGSHRRIWFLPRRPSELARLFIVSSAVSRV